MTDSSNRGRDEGRHPAQMPAQSGRSGGTVATDIGSRDEERTASGGEPEPTRVTKKDKIQPATRTRSDHAGAKQ